MAFFMNVAIQDGRFVPLAHEQVATSIDDVKFEGNDGHLVVTDVRVVWYKKPKKKRGGLLGGFAKALAVGVAGAAASSALRTHGGVVGDIVGRGVETAADATATAIVFDTLASNQLIRRGPDGQAESLAIPLLAIKDITAQGKQLVVTLESGDALVFNSSKAKMLAVAAAQIKSVKQQNKCPYCGAAIPPGSTHCPNCAAPVTSAAAPRAPTPPMAPAAPMAPVAPGPVMMPFPMGIPQIQCPYCRATVTPAKVCPNCGRQLIVTCSKCETDVPLFLYPQGRCPNCGNKLF